MAGDGDGVRSEVLDDAYWRALLCDEEGTSTPESVDDTHDYHVIPPSDSAQTEEAIGNLDGDDREPYSGQELTDSANLPNSEACDDWDRAEAAEHDGSRVALDVVDCNGGGLLVRFGSLSGFVPCSQLAGMPRLLDPEQRWEELKQRIGSQLDVKVIEVDRGNRRLILSEVAAAHGTQDPLCRLQPGDVCHGRVMQIRPFGAFVELGGVEGLVHISELSWGWVSHPADVLAPGEEIDVYVIGVNKPQRKVALSLKRLAPDPWSLVNERYEIGQLVEGAITNVVNFGAFMQLEEGLEGLIHISELADGSFMHPRMVVQEGDKVVARIMDIDSANRRVALSLRNGPIEHRGDDHAQALGH